MPGRLCVSCDTYRVLWASKSVCAICALEWNSKKRKLTERQILEVEAKDRERSEVKKAKQEIKISSQDLLKKHMGKKADSTMDA